MAKFFYSGKYKPKNPEKYLGNVLNVVYRSSWERQVFRFLDENPGVISWSSEETPIPYICGTDKKMHKYMVDLKVTFKTGVTYLIEIKPEWETLPPPIPKKRTKRYNEAVLNYVKNMSKWNAAQIYAKQRGMVFEIWTEKTIKALGIKLI